MLIVRLIATQQCTRWKYNEHLAISGDRVTRTGWNLTDSMHARTALGLQQQRTLCNDEDLAINGESASRTGWNLCPVQLESSLTLSL